MKISLQAALAAVIGINVVTFAEYDMTKPGVPCIRKDVVEHFGAVAQCSMGRPMLTPDQMQGHAVGIAGASDVIWAPLYDAIAYPSAGQLAFSFYSNPIGQGTSSAPGAGANPKTRFDTNLTIGNQLTSGQEFYMVRSETLFYPGVSNAALPLTVLPGAANTVTTVGNFVNDVWSVLNGGLKILAVGTDRRYIEDGPLAMFPPVTRLALQAAVAQVSATGTGTGIEVTYAAASGEPYSIVPIYIQSNQNWTMTVNFAALIPTVSTKIARLMDRMGGYLIRQAT